MKKINVKVTGLALSIILLGCNNNTTDVESNPVRSNTEVIDEHKDGMGSAAIQDETSKPTVLKIAISSPQHKTLVECVKAAELVDVLAAIGPYTVFAPTDEAFVKLPKETIEDLLKPENKSKLQDILQYHVTTNIYSQEQLKDGMIIPMANGKRVTISHKNGEIRVNNAKIIGYVEGSNGNVFVIDEILN